MKVNWKKISLVIALLLFMVILSVSIIGYRRVSYLNSNAYKELLKAKTYEVFEDGSDSVDGTDNVKFTATFLRDIDEDGIAEKLKGTCKPITESDILLFEIIVKSSGYLENGKIEIDGKNFSVSFNEIKDQFIANDCIGEHNRIDLNKMFSGTQKVIMGNIKSQLNNNINNFSRNDNKIVFTGVYVDETGNRVNLRKEIDLTVDWYGDIETSIPGKTNKYTNLDHIKNSETGNVEVNLSFDVKEKKNQLILKENNVEIKIPELNGYKAIDATLTSGNDANVSYNSETGMLTIDKNTEADQDGNVERVYDYVLRGERYINYYLKIIYPPESFDPEEEQGINLYFPIKSYYVGYNNATDGFEGVKTSNIAQNVILVSYHRPLPRDYELGVYIGNYKRGDETYISKLKPYKIYNYISMNETDDDYKVLWSYYTGDNPPTNHIILKEDRNVLDIDEITKSDGTKQSMGDFIANKGIYFSIRSDGFDEDGEISVYDDETNEKLLTVTSRNFYSYTSSTPYMYKRNIKHVRVELKNIKNSTDLVVGHIKTIDDEYLTNTFSEEQFEEFKFISTRVAAYGNNTKLLGIGSTAIYEAPYSVASISVSPDSLRTYETLRNATITLSMKNMEEYNILGWIDGIYLVKIPNDIVDVKINGVASSNPNVEILNYEYIENTNGRFIKVITKNKTDEWISNTITINCDFTADMRAREGKRFFELYAVNSNVQRYSNGYADTYDVDDDENVNEIVSYSSTDMMFYTPSGLLTYEMISDFDEDGTTLLSPQSADIIRRAEVNNEFNTAKITVCLDNRYVSISDIRILGKVPFANNTELLTDLDLNSEFTAFMLPGGLEVPENLRQKGVVVYYSENENPNKDINDIQNGWMRAEDVNNWNEIKTYLIDFGSNNMEKGENYSLSYNVVIPEGVEYNKIAYSHHGVFFNINTLNGKYPSQTAPFKLGLMIARKYNFALTKYQIGKDKVVPNATYVVADMSGVSNNTTSAVSRVTNENGRATFKNLYVNRQYRLKEIDSPVDYELNNSTIEFKVTENSSGSLELNILSGTPRRTSFVEDDETDEYTASIDVEDVEKTRLKIIKTDKTSQEKIQKIYFSISGNNYNKVYGTDQNGEILLKGLRLNEEYTIEEIYGEGYYQITPIIFKIMKQNNEYSYEIIQGNVKEGNITVEDEIPVLSLNIENEEIPRYKVIVEKIEKGNISKKISNAAYSLKSIDNSTTVLKETNENGLFEVDGLYQYVDGREITGKYELNETYAPDGYLLNDELIKFSVSQNTNNELEINIEDRDSLKTLYDVEIDGNNVKFILQNKPIFRLKKIDAKTMEPISGVEFVIKENSNEEDYAKNIFGNYVGTLNDTGEYILTTDRDGIIQVPIRNGKYKAIEVKEQEGYENLGIPTYFEITDDSTNEMFSIGDREITNTIDINYVEDLLDLSNEVKNGNHYETTKINLLRNIDFRDDASYRNPSEPYGDETTAVKEMCLDGFEPIGGGTRNTDIYFSGIFDGQEHEIRNINLASSQNTALFGLVNNAIIMNLGIDGEDINNTGRAAGFAIYIGDITVYNCYNKCNIQVASGSYHESGGILCDYGEARYNGSVNIINCYNEGNIDGSKSAGIEVIDYSLQDLTIKNCYNIGQIKGFSYTGGIIGGEIYSISTPINIFNTYNKGNIIDKDGGDPGAGGIAGGPKYAMVYAENCYNEGNIESNTGDIGGLFGYNYCNITIKNCYNTGNVTAGGSNIGGFVGWNSGNTCIENGYNSGNITGSQYVGGLVGYSSGDGISNSYNVGNIESNGYAGGIGANYNGPINSCFNLGTVMGQYNVGGIVSNTTNIVKNTYNEGHIIGATSSQIGGIAGSGIVSNSYNIGKITILNTVTTTSPVGIISGNSNLGSNTNCYYLDSIPTARLPKTYETSVSGDEIVSKSFYDRLNVDGVWEQRRGRAPTIKGIGTEIKDAIEIEIKNNKLAYEITTEVKEINGNKGGTISGEGELPYEVVEYCHNSSKEIKLTPDENYIISEILINGKNIDFVPEDDGTYTLPGFSEMKEDKHIIACFVPVNSTKFEIEKVEKNTNDKLENAEFYITKDAIEGVRSSQANSMINLYGIENGTYKVIINAEISCEETYDFGWAAITKGSSNSNTNIDNKFINISGIREAQDYESDEFEVTTPEPYFVNIGYYKDYYNVNDVGKDTFIINSIRLLNVDTQEEVDIMDSLTRQNQYYFEKYKNSYVPTNSKYYRKENLVDTDTTFIYMELPFISSGQYHVEIDAKIDNSGDSVGWATISDSSYDDYYESPYVNKIMKISGNKEKETYKSNSFFYDGATRKILNIRYLKNTETSTPEDIFKIYDIRIVPEDNNIGFTNSDGKLKFYVPYGSYSLYEKTAPDGYQKIKEPLQIVFQENGQSVFRIENEKMPKVIAHHYLKDENGLYTTTKLAEDQEYSGEVGEHYSIQPHIDLEDYTLEKDENNNYVIPENASGVYSNGVTEVIYYYERTKIPLIVHHYIMGTEDKVLLSDGSEAGDVIESGVQGTPYETEPISEDELNEKYELVSVTNNNAGTYEYTEVEVIYYYRIKEFDIKTSVKEYEIVDILGNTRQIRGGIISGENDETYETVEYGEDSTKEIKAIPDEGYRVSQITVNDEPIEFTVNNDGSVTLGNFIDMRSNKNVVVTFSPAEGIIKVNHYIEGTEERITDLDGNTVEEEIRSGPIGSAYATKGRDDLSDKYELVGIPSKTSGQYGEQEVVLNYYYRIKKYPYVVNYLLMDEDTDDTNNTVLHEQKADGLLYDYGTQILPVNEKIEIDGYVYVSANVDALKITEQDNVLTLYYVVDNGRTKEVAYNVEYYKDGEKQANDTQNEIVNVPELGPDSTDLDKTKINIVDKYEGYKLEKITLNDEEVADIDDENNKTYKLPNQVNNGDTIKVYYVRDDNQTKEITYKVEYYKNNTQITEDAFSHTETVQELVETINVNKTEINTTDKYPGYELDKIVVNEEIVAVIPDTAKDDDVIKVYYKAKDSQIIVRYVDEAGNIIKKDYIINGKVDETVDLSRVDDKVDGYELKSKSAEGVVTFEETTKVVEYVYKKNKPAENQNTNTNSSTNSTTYTNNTTIINNIYVTTNNEIINQESQTQSGTQTVSTGTKTDTSSDTSNNKISITDASNNVEKKPAVEKVANPGTGDQAPIIAYSVIAIVILANIIVYRRNKAFLKKQGLNDRSLEFAVIKRQAKREKIIGKRTTNNRGKGWKERGKH